ncbi:MAG TPA: hypothetical protein VFZ65_13730 [Planctomycetota bacterium]|nr:hypothetical protein [Planctomycetota bacterium]
MAWRTLLVLALCALIGGAAWLLWRDDTTRPTVGGTAAGPSTAAPPDVASDRAVPASAALSSVEQRSLAPAAPEAVALGAMVQLRVLGSDGVPLAGIAVRYTSEGEAQIARATLAADEPARLGDDSEELLRRFGAVATTDTAGIARWPWHEQARASWHCVARHGDDFGETWVSMKELAATVHELELHGDVRFVVGVENAARQPASDVPLRARFEMRTEGDKESAMQLGRTHTDGRFTASHVQAWSPGITPRGAMLPATIETDLPGITIGREIDVARPPAEAVRLTLPPAGSIEVTVRNAFAEPAPNELCSIIEAAAAPGHAHCITTDASGIARFPFVGLGRRWRFLGLGPGWRVAREHSAPDPEHVIEGPRTTGEVVRVALQPDPVPVLLGQLLRDGSAATETEFEMFSAGEHVAWGQRTDAEGRFRVALRHSWRDKVLTEVVICCSSGDHGYDGTSATWRGQVVASVGPHDLGGLHLQPDPVLCEGQLVASGPATRNDVRLRLETVSPPSPGASGALSVRPRHDPDGHFAFFGKAPEAALQIAVETRNKYLPVAPVPFVAGARDLRIELQSGGSVRASIVAGSHVASFCLQPMLVPIGRQVAMPDHARFFPQLDPRLPCEHAFVRDDPLETAYTWPAVVPGSYRLEIHTRNVRRPMLVIPDVVVVDGERNEDPRLQHLVVPGLHTVEITLPQADLVDSPPGTRGRGAIFVLEGDEPGEQCWQVDSKTAVFAAAQPLDLLVRLYGHRDRIVRGIVADQTIELEPGLPATLRCEGFAPPVGSTVELSLESLDDTATNSNASVFSAAAGGVGPPYRLRPFAADLAAGEAKVLLPAPGRYRVAASLCAADGGKVALDVAPALLTIGAAGGEFAVALRAR